MAKTFTIANYIINTPPSNDITSGLSTAENLFGTPGTDIYFGYFGNDIIRGNTGDDFLAGEADNDSLSGEAGDDFLFFSDNNFFDSGYAQQFISFGGPISEEKNRQFMDDEWFDVFNVSAPNNPGTDISINGGTGNDTAIIDFSFFGTAQTVVFNAGGTFTLPNGTTSVSEVENLWLRGGAGADDFTGGANADRLYGADGADKLKGAGGDDFLFGGNGQDDLRGGDGNDFLVSTNYFTEFYRDGAFRPYDYVSGLYNIWTATTPLTAAQKDTFIDGGTGNDTAVIDFEGNAAAVNFALNPALLQNLPGLDTQMTGVEAIWVIDSGNDDTITSGAGNDRFLSVGGTDTFDAGDGIDTIEVLSGSVDLETRTANGDSVSNFENIVGAFDGSTLKGNDLANTIWGRGGDDTLNGGGGDDTLDGGTGGDVLNGGGGVNTASYASATASVLVDLTTPGFNQGDAVGDSYIGIANLIGSRRGDSLLGDAADNRIDGGLGRDLVQGRNGNDTFVASANNDSFDGGDGADTLILSGLRSDYTIVAIPSGGFTITDKRGANFDGTDTVTTVENFNFADQTRTEANLVNIAPSAPAFAQFAPLPEDAAAGTVVGTLSSSDPDGDPVTYTLDSAASALFTLEGNVLKLKAGANIDFDAATGGSSTRNFAVTASDGRGGSTLSNLVLNIANSTADNLAPSAPTFAQGAPLPEDAAAGTVVGTLASSDPDGDPVTFSLDANGATLFTLEGNVLKLKAGANIDFDPSTGGSATRNFAVTATDPNGGATTANLVLNIANSNSDNRAPNAPSFSQNGPLPEDADAGTVVGTLAATDPDGDAVTFSLSSAASALFTLDGNVLKLKAGADIDFDAFSGGSSTRTFAVTASDANGGSTTANLVLKIANDKSDDRIQGNDKPNTLKGTPGDDKMFGLGGNDILEGSNGDDRMDGGSGTDTVRYTARVELDLTQTDGSGNSGQAAGDTFISIERFIFSRFNDTAIGNKAANTFSGGDGNDIFRGGAGNDFLYGENGNDSLFGDAGNDTLSAGDGNDSLRGGAGKDTMKGGTGRDNFIFDTKIEKDALADRIVDFNAADDTFRLDDGFFAGLAKGRLAEKFFTDLSKDTVTENSRIIYDRANTDLYFDRDGSKDGFDRVKFADLDKKVVLSEADFIVF